MLLSFSVGSAEIHCAHVCSTTAFVSPLVRCHITRIPILVDCEKDAKK